MTTSLRPLLSLLSLLLMRVRVQAGTTPCHICGDRGNGAMHYPNVVLANVGKSCTQISLDVALNVGYGTGQCTAKQNEWKGRCCTPGQRPAGSDPPRGLPAQNIPNVQYVGPNPPCHICRDGDYPYATSMVINFLYIGAGSCAQYYRYGREGRIQQHMCDPVKFFSYEPCGCGEFNPYFNSNHPANQQAQQAPQQNGGGNSGGSNSGGNSGGNINQPNQQRTPGEYGNQNCAKLSNNYGGAGAVMKNCGNGNGRRLEQKKPLRGSSKNKKDYDSIAVVAEDSAQDELEE